jgi:hypothetical protein
MSRIHDSLKRHRNVSKQTNPLQMDNLITNKPVAISEASRRIMNTQCVKIPVLANLKIFKNIMTLRYCMVPTGQREEYVGFPWGGGTQPYGSF